jgi:hypothetical protein
LSGDFSPRAALIGLLFVALGVLFFLDAIDAIHLRLGVILPLAVIGAGLAVIAGAMRRRT